MKKISAIIIAATLSLGFYSCGNDANMEEKPAEAAKEEHAEGAVELTEAQMKSIGVEIGTIEQKQLTASLKANGVLRVPNQNKAQINSVYPGVIKTLLVQPGNTVTKGQVIATVGNPQFIITQEEYLSLTPKITLAQQEVTRQQELIQGNAGALKNLQAAESNLRTMQTRKVSLEEQLRLMGISPAKLSGTHLISVIPVMSPINGVVSNVTVKIGSYVDTNTPILDLVDNSQLHLDLFVYEKDLSKLKENQTIHFTLTNNPGKEYDAQIYSLGSSFEDESKAVSVHALVKGDKQGLIDGMNITALISLENITAPAVPTDAIVTMQGQDFIFAVSEKQEAHAGETVFEKIPVAKGTTDVGYTQVTLLKNIAPNTKIVTKGAFFVQAKMVNTGEGEHEH
ncbi:efflux RND transporter periplasmic adaptor subunit [Niastella sp. OAS944]|uniref:efflux RND transporter periplasmic adaptor subunit n=1 Tax=Niastella sp. OAS944 TaxID=2664089 RepID=UPI00347F4F84|nr:RND family efflux transporter MFP subunit [Chitinophagaceae bacterium OAS944]